MSLEQQQAEASLLKERWSLRQQEVDKKDIKLRSPILYVQGRKYAEFKNSSLVKFFTIGSSTPTGEDTTITDLSSTSASTSVTATVNDNSSTSSQATAPLLSPTSQPEPDDYTILTVKILLLLSILNCH